MSKVDRNNVEDILAVTPTQAGMLFHYLREPDSDDYVVQVSLRLRGLLDRSAFEAAWNSVAGAHEMLRATFRWEEASQPVQIVLKQAPPVIAYRDLSGLSTAQAQEVLDSYRATDRRAGLDLKKVPFRIALFQLGADLCETVLTYHNILCDGWSIGVVIQEFLRAYGQPAGGDLPRPPKARVKDFLKWRLGLDSQADTKYWSDYLNGLQATTPLTVKWQPGEAPARHSARITQCMPAELVDAIRNFGREKRLTLSVILYSAWAVLLSRYTDSDDVIFGTTVAGRPAEIPGIERTVGLFINTPPLRLQVEAGDTFDAVAQRVRALLPAREEHQWTAPVEIQRASGRGAGEEPFNNIFVVENYPLSVQDNTGPLRIESYSFTEATHYDLTVMVRAFDGLTLDFCYRADRLHEDAVARLGQHYLRLLSACISRPGAAISRIAMLEDAERRALAENFQGAQTDWRGGTLADWFDEAAARYSERVALVCRKESICYGELKERVHSLASLLMLRGVGPGSIVGVMVDRSIEMIVAILGVLKAGGAYLPLSRSLPAERIELMLRDSAADVVIVNGDRANPGGAPALELRETAGRRAPAAKVAEAGPESPAYVLYTSGSTGAPKGVVVPHRAVLNLLGWIQSSFEFTAEDVILQNTPITFDVSVWELFSWMLAGARLCLLEPGEEKDPSAIVRAIQRNRVSAMHLVPSMLPVFLEHVETYGEANALNGLRFLFASGEPLRGGVLHRLWKVAGGNAKLRVFNNYGPTETTVWSSSHECARSHPSAEPVPIGRPVANTRFYVLDRWGNPQPRGVWGELYIAGACLAQGYLNQPELTAERFGRIPIAENQIAYRTGDIVRRLADGNLEFGGRRDHQVKIRGHRIELGEIECRLLALEGIQSAAVIARPASDNGVELWAYYTSREPRDEAELRSWLAKRLPAVMIPSHFTRLQSMPVNANGKIDARALPAADNVPAQTAQDVMAQSSDLVEQIAAVLAEVLSLPESAVGPGSDFFQLGGNSLSAISLTSALLRRLGARIPLATVFENPTPRALAEVVRRTPRSSLQSIERTEEREYYDLSFNQKRLWIAQELRPGSASYNLAGRLEFHHPVDREQVTVALNALIQRHEMLRARFMVVKGAPAQAISKTGYARVVVQDLSSTLPGALEEARRQWLLRESVLPFDLSRSPLVRTTLLKLGESHYELVVNMPHIISDGWSLEVLKDEFERLFYSNGAEQLPPLPIQYRDYVAWQSSTIAGGNSIRDAKAFWSSVLKDDLPALDLPEDYLPKPGGVHRSSAYRVVVPAELTNRLRDWSRRRQSGLFLPQMAALQLTIAQITGQDDILIGFVAAARQHEFLRGVVGMFANTLVLRTKVDKEQRMADFCQSVQTQLLQSLEHQSIPLELVCDELRIRFPQISVFLNFLNLGTEYRLPVSDFSARHIPEIQESKFPLHYCVTEFSNGIEIVCDYYADLFRKETIERKMEILLHYLDAVTSAEEETIRASVPGGRSRKLVRQSS